MVSKTTVVLAVIGIAMLIGYGFAVFGWLNVNYTYRHAIGAYIDNAYDAPNFEVMKSNLISAYGGMVNQSLLPADCGKAWGFEQTQDWCMAYQYQYLLGLINRTDFYLDRVRAGNISQFSDVYEQMIHNMRDEMTRNGPTDWVAQPAWLLKYAPAYYWHVYDMTFLTGGIFVIVAAAAKSILEG